MAKPNKKKLLEIYAKTSTPQELFLDTLEKVEKVEQKIGEVNSRFDETLEYINENKPKSNEELVEIIKPLIPGKPKDGHTPTEQEIIDFIKPLIPDAIPGKDGNQITPEEVRDKLKQLKGKDRLSVLDLKDLEWLKTKEGMQWSSAGFKVYTDATLEGDGSFSNPLKVVGGGSGTGNYTPQGITASTVGGLTAGTDLGTTPIPVQTVLDDMLYPYTAPAVTLSLSPAVGYREHGNPVTSVVLTAHTTKHTDDITSVQFYRNSPLLYTVPSPNPNGGTETYTDTTPVTSNTIYVCKVSDGTTTTISSNQAYYFIYPYLDGQNPTGELFADMYTDFTHLIQVQGTKTITYNLTVGNVPYFGFPASYADLTSIKDENGFETFPDWTKRTGNVVGLDSTSQSYKVYEFKNATGSAVTKSFTFA